MSAGASVLRCRSCLRPLGNAPECPRCSTGLAELTEAIRTATGKRATFREAYDFAKSITTRELEDRRFEAAIHAAFALAPGKTEPQQEER